MDNEYTNAADLSKDIKMFEKEYNQLNNRLHAIGGHLSHKETERWKQLQVLLTKLRTQQKRLVNIRKSSRAMFRIIPYFFSINIPFLHRLFLNVYQEKLCMCSHNK